MERLYQPNGCVPITGEVKIHHISVCFLRVAGCQEGPGELIVLN